MPEYKVVVFGSGAVGKSALTIEFVQGYFATDYEPTIEDAYKRAVDVDRETVLLDILDTSGQDDFAPMRTAYMRQGKGFIIVYAIDSRQSFEEVESFHQDLVRTKGTANIPLVICGNKSDLTDKRVVSRLEGEELAVRFSAVFLETSALTNTNVDNAFLSLIKEIKRQQQLPTTSPVSESPQKKKRSKKDKCLIL
jgi:small GTP-binding protein